MRRFVLRHVSAEAQRYGHAGKRAQPISAAPFASTNSCCYPSTSRNPPGWDGHSHSRSHHFISLPARARTQVFAPLNMYILFSFDIHGLQRLCATAPDFMRGLSRLPIRVRSTSPSWCSALLHGERRLRDVCTRLAHFAREARACAPEGSARRTAPPRARSHPQLPYSRFAEVRLCACRTPWPASHKPARCRRTLADAIHRVR
eukprot:6182485-Pleurochrysis_carterae.AAC.2